MKTKQKYYFKKIRLYKVCSRNNDDEVFVGDFRKEVWFAIT